MARFFNFPLSIYIGLIDTNGLGAGLIFPQSKFNLVHFFDTYETFSSTTAHGGLIGLVYTYGFIGLIFCFLFYIILIRGIKNITQQFDIKFYSLLFVFTVLFLFDISLSDPSRLFVLGYFLQLAKEEKLKKQ